MKFHESPTIYVNEVTLKVENLARSLEFYTDIIGFKIYKRTKDKAELTADGSTVLLKLEQPEDVIGKQARRTGLYHFALLLPSRSHLANFVHHLTENGIRFGSADHLVSEALYLADLDGNEIEVYVDRDPSVWRWNKDEVQMATLPLNFKQLLGERQGTWGKLPSETIVGHIHLHVADLASAEKFYTAGLGFTVVNRFGSQALFISDGDYHHHIGLNTWNGVGAPAPLVNSVGMKSYQLMLPSKKKRNQIISQLKTIGAPVWEEDGVYMTSDPSSNKLMLQI